MRTRIVITSMMLLTCSMAHCEEENVAPVFDGNRAKGYVAHLSTDAMQGRMTCTEGYREAADWVAANFRRWGLAPAGENGTYFQEVEIRGFDWHTGIPRLFVGSREFLLDDGDFSIESPSSPGVTIEGEIVFVGYGFAAPDKGLNEYETVDVKGKIVLAFKGSPNDAPQRRIRFGGPPSESNEKKQADETDWTEESKDSTKIKTAYDQGAAGVLLFDPDETAEGETSRRRRSYRRSSGDTWKLERDFVGVTITERVFRTIMRANPQESRRGLKRRMDNVRRGIQRKEPQSAATGVRAKLKGYDQSIRYDEENGNNTARNVLAKIDGTDPTVKDQCILVGAHLDHVGVRNGYVYNGADDNASGSAVVMELARLFAQSSFKPRRTLIFACWCGEEGGLLGSLHYTRHPTAGVKMEQMVGSFNLDMVGMGATLGASGALNFPSIWEVIKRDQEADVLKLIEPSVGGTGGSDHTGFIRKGIETVFLMSRGGVGHQDYHQPEDDIEKIEPEMLRLAGQFTLQGMMNLANEAEVNLLIPRRQDRYNALRMRIAKLNPELKESTWTVVDLKADSGNALYVQICDSLRAMIKKSQSSDNETSRRGAQSAGGPPSKSITRGLANVEIMATDTRLLDLVIDTHGIGRVDLKADHPLWVEKGRLTKDGETMLGALEERGVVLRLLSPEKQLIKDVLDAASKPFVMTGNYEIPEELIDRLTSRGVLCGADFDPRDVTGFITRVEQLKTHLGDRKNLFAYLTSLEGLEDAKIPLYLGLVDRGWAHREIVGDREHQGLVGGASLSSLGTQSSES